MAVNSNSGGICPNCSGVVLPDHGVKIIDVYGRTHWIHKKCNSDVWSGWSGSVLLPKEGQDPLDAISECLRSNYRQVGIELEVGRTPE